jgi:hypothetical protein
MHSVHPVLTALRTALPRVGRPLRNAVRCSTETGGDHQPRPREAARGLDGFAPSSYPPYETVEVGPTITDARKHGVVVWNDGPKRTLSLSVRSAAVASRAPTGQRHAYSRDATNQDNDSGP